MSSDAQERGPCPLSLGDRVDHPKFGFGKVVSDPIAMVGPISDQQALGGYRLGAKGWHMDIEWEDEGRGTFSMSSEILTLVESPDAKGALYWQSQFEKLLNAALRERTRTQEKMQCAFRGREEPSSGATTIRESIEKEKSSLDALLAFLDADEADNHP